MDIFERNFLIQNGRVVAHMRAQIDNGRFGLVFGAGVSKPLQFPNWGELVERIANDPSVKGERIIASAGRNLSDISKTQMLFQHYRTKEIESASEPLTAKLARRIQGQWRRIIHKALYEKVSSDPKELRTKHPYLQYLDTRN